MFYKEEIQAERGSDLSTISQKCRACPCLPAPEQCPQEVGRWILTGSLVHTGFSSWQGWAQVRRLCLSLPPIQAKMQTLPLGLEEQKLGTFK